MKLRLGSVLTYGSRRIDYCRLIRANTYVPPIQSKQMRMLARLISRTHHLPKGRKVKITTQHRGREMTRHVVRRFLAVKNQVSERVAGYRFEPRLDSDSHLVN